MKYLPLYYEWMETGELPRCGLCNCLGEGVDYNTWNFYPKFKDFLLMHPLDSDQVADSQYWAAEHRTFRARDFNPLRQNIILFLAAMNGEL